jgi:hypothetical protein
MKIKDGLQLKGRPVEIPDCGRDDLPQFFVDMGYKVGVEIGTQEGNYAETICKAGLTLYAVDPWKNYADYWGEGAFQDILDKQYEDCQKKLVPYNVTFHRETSMEAVKKFVDESLDFVYIDGNHELKYVIEDIFEWSKKVKVGGTIAGHDYFYAHPRKHDNIHVRYAVDAYTESYRIKKWYLIGRKKIIEGEVRDPFRSFFWIKK